MPLAASLLGPHARRLPIVGHRHPSDVADGLAGFGGGCQHRPDLASSSREWRLLWLRWHELGLEIDGTPLICSQRNTPFTRSESSRLTARWLIPAEEIGRSGRIRASCDSGRWRYSCLPSTASSKTLAAALRRSSRSIILLRPSLPLPYTPSVASPSRFLPSRRAIGDDGVAARACGEPASDWDDIPTDRSRQDRRPARWTWATIASSHARAGEYHAPLPSHARLRLMSSTKRRLICWHLASISISPVAVSAWCRAEAVPTALRMLQYIPPLQVSKSAAQIVSDTGITKQAPKVVSQPKRRGCGLRRERQDDEIMPGWRSAEALLERRRAPRPSRNNMVIPGYRHVGVQHRIVPCVANSPGFKPPYHQPVDDKGTCYRFFRAATA
uniref:Uncharacterized protein n=1 Tax=Oryza punctata TaxID=4537 RepID=A0A0E0M7C8_ORYPU